MAQGSPMPGEKYLHFKKRMYQVIAIAYHSETMEKQVVYQALYGDFKIYVRPYDMFVSKVDHEKYPEVAQKYRFQYVADSAEEPQEVMESHTMTKVVSDEKPLQEVNGSESGADRSSENDGQMSGADNKTVQEAEKRTTSGEGGEAAKKPEKALRILRAEDAADRRRVAAAGGQTEASDESDDEEERLNPWLEKFLDADDFDEKYRIVCDMHREVTDRLIDDIAVVMDLAIPDGDVKDRYDQLKYCMRTRQRYEQGRLR